MAAGSAGRDDPCPSSTSPRLRRAAIAGTALNNARDLARHAERLGYKRFWMAEHHSMPGIASAATAVALVPCRGRDQHDPRRRGRDHAAQSFAPAGRRTIRHARGAVSRPDRPRARPRAGDRPGGRLRHAAQPRVAMPANFPRDVVELMALFRPPRARPAGARHPRRGHGHPGLDPRIEPVRRRARRPPRACPMPSLRTSRRNR